MAMLHHRELYHQILLNKSQLGEQKPDVSTVLLDLHKLLENISAFLSLLELFGLGVASPDDIVRQPSQLGSIEPVRLGSRTLGQFVEEGDILLGDVLMTLVLHHTGHVGGHHALPLLPRQAVVMGGEHGPGPDSR